MTMQWVKKTEKPDEVMKRYPIRYMIDGEFIYSAAFHDEVGWSEFHIMNFEWLKPVESGGGMREALEADNIRLREALIYLMEGVSGLPPLTAIEGTLIKHFEKAKAALETGK